MKSIAVRTGKRLPSNLTETTHWFKTGISLFIKLLKTSGLAPPSQPFLTQLVPD